MTESELLDKLERKYERPKPGACCVCGGAVEIAHTGGGLPLRWVCGAAKRESETGEVSTEVREHLDRSAFMDYRAMGDARVMQLIRMYRELRSKIPVADVERAVESVPGE